MLLLVLSLAHANAFIASLVLEVVGVGATIARFKHHKRRLAQGNGVDSGINASSVVTNNQVNVQFQERLGESANFDYVVGTIGLLGGFIEFLNSQQDGPLWIESDGGGGILFSNNTAQGAPHIYPVNGGLWTMDNDNVGGTNVTQLPCLERAGVLTY